MAYNGNRSRGSGYSRNNKYGARAQYQRVRSNPVEVKYHLTEHSHDFALSNPHTGILTTLTSGSGRDQRVGNQATILNIKGTWGSPAINSEFVRFIIYIPRQATNVLTPALITSAVDPNEFIVLYDKLWRPESYAGDDMINFNIPMKRNVRYKGTGSADYVTPVVKYFAMCSNPLVGTKVSQGNWVTTFVG